ncbi:MAG: polysaccharide biosynthesis tyrosine autokinase [Planctomycetota bacterium]|nr:polysaccharide biosynthesis tyrosine autokinase [Planctomycetota bacterium]
MNNHPERQDWGAADPPSQASFDFVGMLQRRFWIIILCVIFATGGGVFWYWKSEVKYSSVARTHIYFQRPEVSIIGSDSFQTTTSINSHHELFKSEEVLKKVATSIKQTIQNQNSTIQKADSAEQKNEPGGGAEKARDEAATDANIAKSVQFSEFHNLEIPQILSRLLKSLDINPDRQDKNIYHLSYTGNDKNDCSTILDMVIDKYDEHLTNKYESEGQKIISNIENARTTIAKEISDLNGELEQWRTKNGDSLDKYSEGLLVSDSGDKSNGYRVEAQELYKEIASLEKERSRIADDQKWIDNAIATKMSKQEILTHIDKFSEWLQIEQRKSTSAANNRPEKKLPLQFEEPEPPADLMEARFAVTQKEGEIEEMISKGFGENYPGLRTLKRQMSELQAKVKFLDDHFQGRVKKAKQKFEELKKQSESVVELDTSELPKILNEIDLIGLQKTFLDHKLVRLDNDLASLRLKYESKVAQSNIVEKLLSEERALMGQINLKMDLSKTVNQKISEINMEKGNGFYIVDRLKNPSRGLQAEPNMLKIFAITTFLGLLVGVGLGYLVEVADKTFRNPAEIAQQLGMQVIGHVPVLTTKKVNAKGSAMDESLIAFHLPKSQQSEAFRAIRTSLFFNSQGKNSQIIQVTSPTPGDGKSTLAANLAISLAQSGKRVLMVDADLRRPTVNYLFGTDSEIGFAAVLNGDAEIDDAIVDSEVAGLSIMPAGSRPSNPAELLTSSHLYDLFEVLREKFDFVIMDSPPMLAVTDPAALAARADGVIVTLRIKKNVKLSATRSKEVLDSVDAKIMGIVVNGAGMVQGTYSNSAAYGYGYGSGYSGSYYSYGYDYGESSYYYDEDSVPTAARR